MDKKQYLHFIETLLEVSLYDLIETNSPNKELIEKVLLDFDQDYIGHDGVKDFFKAINKFLVAERLRYKFSKNPFLKLRQRTRKQTEYLALMGKIYTIFFKQVDDNLSKELETITAHLTLEERIELFEDFIITATYSELVKKFDVISRETKKAFEEYNKLDQKMEWYPFLQARLARAPVLINDHQFIRFFEHMTLSEKRNPSCTLRVVSNKLNRYQSSKRAEYWEEKFNKWHDGISVRITNQFDRISSKISNILLSKPEAEDDFKNAFGCFLIVLSLRYQFAFKLVKDSLSVDLFYKKSEMNKIKQADLLEINRRIIQRCQNVFTFVRIIAKHYAEFIHPDRQLSEIIQALNALNRGYAYLLDAKHEEAFNDLTLTQRILRKLSSKKNSLGMLYKELLYPVTLGLKGECYRRDYSYDNSFYYYCNSVVYFSDLFKRKKGYEKLLHESFFLLRAKINKSKMFLEKGDFRRALKWNLRALRQVFNMLLLSNEMSTLKSELCHINERIRQLVDYLEKNKYEPDVDKFPIHEFIKPLTQAMENSITSNYASIKENCMASVLLSDILNRISIILYLINFSRISDNQGHFFAYRWLKLALMIDENNGLAQYNKLLYLTYENAANDILSELPELKRNCLRHEGPIFDIANRHFSTAILSSMAKLDHNNTDHGEKDTAIASKLLSTLLLYTDNFAKKNMEIFKYIAKERVIGRKRFRNESIFYCLKRWGSYTPIIPRPSTFLNRGGGFLVIHNNKGIAIDPGFDFLINLYQEGFSISDIDAVIITHDHVDHSANLDSLLSLWHYGAKLTGHKRSQGKEMKELFLNTGMLERYSFLLRDKNYQIHSLSAGAIVKPEDHDFRFKIDVKKAQHRELGTDKYSIGFQLILNDDKSERLYQIGFTGDTAYREEILDQYWDADLLVVNICTITFPEMKYLLDLDMDSSYFKDLNSFFSNLKGDPMIDNCLRDLQFSYWYTKDENELFLPPSLPTDLEQHIYLLGILAYNKKLQKRISSPDPNTKYPKVIAISELREEIGSFRNKLAVFLNRENEKKWDRDTTGKPKYITADIGLSARFRKENSRDAVVYLSCTKCKLSNDSLFDDIYHHPHNIIDFCIKAEEEGLFYLCRRHDTTDEHKDSMKEQFHQRAEKYNIFGHRSI